MDRDSAQRHRVSSDRKHSLRVDVIDPHLTLPLGKRWKLLDSSIDDSHPFRSEQQLDSAMVHESRVDMRQQRRRTLRCGECGPIRGHPPHGSAAAQWATHLFGQARSGPAGRAPARRRPVAPWRVDDALAVGRYCSPGELIGGSSAGCAAGCGSTPGWATPPAPPRARKAAERNARLDLDA